MVPNCFRGARKQSAHGWRWKPTIGRGYKSNGIEKRAEGGRRTNPEPGSGIRGEKKNDFSNNAFAPNLIRRGGSSSRHNADVGNQRSDEATSPMGSRNEQRAGEGPIPSQGPESEEKGRMTFPTMRLRLT